MRHAGKIVFAFLITGLLGIDAASAQPSPAAATADPAKQAETLFHEGFALVKQSRWVEAEAKLRAAWKLNPTYDIAANLGHAQIRLLKFRDAAENLDFAVRNWPVIGKPEPKEEALKQLKQLRTAVASVRVSVSIPGAAVLVDGKNVGTSPIEHDLFVDPGTRTIEASLPGHDTAKQVVETKMGESLKVELSPTLTRAAVTENEPKHEVPAPRVQPPEERSWVPEIALGAAGVVGVGVAIGLTVASNDASDEAHAQSAAIRNAGGRCVQSPSTSVSPCTELDRTVSRSDGFRDGARVAYLTSGALVIAAVTYALWPRALHASPEPLRARLDVQANGASIGVLGTW